MGLDITAYKNLKEVKNPQRDESGELVNDDTEYTPGVSMEWSEKHFAGRGEGIESNKVYSWEEKYRFRAGSYSGYGWWRNCLEDFKGEVAFQELINFADNEGVIGPVVSKKLFNDFVNYLEDAKEYAKTLGSNDVWWLEKYIDWMAAFEYATENGAVDFH